MGKIVLLDELTINQIAAGEVIERPASVVKEMLENSIDAGAKNITIEVKNGGISLIRITDDGCGISEDDMEIAFERHATSKIRNAVDLQTVRTMGFRGEALASITSIANVEMISKTKEDIVGHKIVIEGGKVLKKEEVAATTGTRITVQNLFFNTPVRYKFLKKDYTEAGYIEDVVTRIALINKEVSIKLINNDKVLLQTTGGLDTKNLIYSIYGKDVANGTKEVEYNYEDIKITGVIGLPEISRSNRSNQLFFVNGRFVRDKNLTAGVEQAYKSLIPVGKYAFIILNLEMNPNQVDVNVHPAKLEVRFEDEQKVFKAVYNAVKYALGDVTNTSENNGKENNESDLLNFTDNKEQEVKKSFGGLFKSIIKEKEDDEEEKNNTLLEIFNSRKLEENLSIPTNFIKKEEIKQETKEENRNQDIFVDLSENNLKPNIVESIVLTEEKEDFKKENPLENLMESNFVGQSNIVNKEGYLVDKKEEKTTEPAIPSLAEVEKITSKILEMKINSIDNTQMIDTSKVREAISENKKVTPEFADMYKKTFGLEANEIRKEREIEEQEKKKIYISNEFINAENENLFEKQEEIEERIKYKFVGIVFEKYIIIEYKDEMYIIDEISARERINYEKVKYNYYSSIKNSSTLLLPDIITCSFKEMSVAKENIELFRKAGFNFEEFGENTIKLTEVPLMYEELNTKSLFLKILNEIENVAVNDTEEKEKKFIKAIAVNSIIKPKINLDEREVDKLVQELLSLEEPFAIPHGKSTAIKISKNDIEKKFSRRK